MTEEVQWTRKKDGSIVTDFILIINFVHEDEAIGGRCLHLPLVTSVQVPLVVVQTLSMGAQAQCPSHVVGEQRRRRTRAPSWDELEEVSNVEWCRLLGIPTWNGNVFNQYKDERNDSISKEILYQCLKENPREPILKDFSHLPMRKIPQGSIHLALGVSCNGILVT